MALMWLLLGLSMIPLLCNAQTCAPCHQNAMCMTGNCTCNAGFTGNGTECQDFNECTATNSDRHTCDESISVCMNTDGDYNCICNAGYSNNNGDGKTCEDDPPVFDTPCPAHINRFADPSSTSTTVTWTDPTASDGADGGSVTVACNPVSGSELAIGTHPVTCTTAMDSAGNTQHCSFDVIITDFNECTASMGTPGRHDCVNAVCNNEDGGFSCTCNPGYSKPNMDDHTCTDTDPPVFTPDSCPQAISRVADPSSTVTMVTWTDPTATDSTNVAPTVECTPASDTDFTIGPTLVTCTATDAAGNEATPDCTFTVTVTDFDECGAPEGSAGRHDCVNARCDNVDGGFTCTCNNGYNKPNMDDHTCTDTTPPVFDPNTCRSPDTQVADPGSMTSTTVTWTTPTATDTTGIAPTVTCTPSTSDAFRIGHTAVTCTATDDAGNMALPNCAFTVTVIDFDECSAVMNGDNCDTFANCTNIDGGFLCTCTAGYTGNGVTCTECDDGYFGLNCLSPCTCVDGADCNNVNGSCTCTPGFTNAVCDKNYLDVELSVTEEPVLDTAAVDNASLRCQVNLPSGDLDPLNPVTITNPDGTSETASMIMEGLYEIIVLDISPANSGKYTCTATTVINGVGLSKSDEFELDVLAPGRIISLNVSTEGKLGETVTVDCVVYARPRPVLTWYDKSNAVIETTDPKYSISSVDGQERLTSSLSVLNLARSDNGTYVCETASTLTQDEDQKEAAIIVIEVPEVDNVDAMAISATEVEVMWRVSYDGNALPFMCKVDYRKLARPDWTLGAFAEEPPLSRRITNLVAYTEYPVRVICQNRAGVGLEVMRPNPIRTLQAAPDAPENVRVTAITSSSLTVEWDAPVIKRGTIAYYVVTVDSTIDDPKSRQTPGSGNPAPLSLVVSELSPYRDYTIYVTAFNVERGIPLMGDDSDSIVRKTAQIDVPSAPVNVLLDNEGDTCVVTWDPPEQEIGTIVSYKIFRNAYLFPDAVSENTGETADLDVSDSVVTDATRRLYSVQKMDLPAYTRYRFQISASTSTSEGPTSMETKMTCDSPRRVPANFLPLVLSDTSRYQITETTIKLRIAPVSQRNGPVSCVEVTVIRLNDDEGIEGKDPDILYHPNLLRTFDKAQESTGLPYVAMVFKGNDLSESVEIEIGSGGESSCGRSRRKKRQMLPSHSGENGPLIPETKYTAFIRAYVILDNQMEDYVTSQLLQPVWTDPAETGNVTIIAVVCVVGTLIIIALVACGVGLMWRKKRRARKNSRPKRTAMEMDNVDYEVTLTEGGIASTVYEDVGLPSWALRWEILWKNLVLDDKVLGQGNFGEVRSGTVNIGGKRTKTAIKILKGHASETDRKDFMEEFRTMTNIGYHPNVVSLLGACQNGDVLYVALEFLPNGDLRSYLRTARSQSESDEGALSSDQLIKFALDVAKGMKHLSMSGVIHRDLAARNILLGERLVAKVSDFGLSRGEDIYVQTSMRRVPTRWLAIESLLDRTYTTQSDVWSFGILIWEIASIGGTPYATIATKALAGRLMEGYRMTKPANCDEQIYSLMLRCWEEDPSNRPSFSDLIRIISKMDENKTEQTYMAIDRDHYENFSVIRPELDDN